MPQPASNDTLVTAPSEIKTLDELRDYIHVALCRKENLLEHHFPMTELELKRSGNRCGYQYILHGPRSVKLSAVWDQVSNEILLYDVVGRRFDRVRTPNLGA